MRADQNRTPSSVRSHPPLACNSIRFSATGLNNGSGNHGFELKIDGALCTVSAIRSASSFHGGGDIGASDTSIVSASISGHAAPSAGGQPANGPLTSAVRSCFAGRSSAGPKSRPAQWESGSAGGHQDRLDAGRSYSPIGCPARGPVSARASPWQRTIGRPETGARVRALRITAERRQAQPQRPAPCAGSSGTSQVAPAGGERRREPHRGHPRLRYEASPSDSEG